MPRARLNTADGKTTEWKSKALRADQRRTLVADALIAGAVAAALRSPCEVAERRSGGDDRRASSTFWPSSRTPRTTRSETEVALRSSRTIGSSASTPHLLGNGS